jgi:type IV pilus assembly protein PilB
MNNDLLKKILVDGSYITSADFKAAEKESTASHRPLVEHLVADGLLTRDILGQATAEYYKLSYFDLSAYPPTKELVQKLPEDFSRSYRVVAVKETKEWLTLATDTPDETKLVPELKKIITKTKVELVYSLPEDIDTILLSYKRELDTRFAKIIKESKRIAPDIIEQIVDDALSLKASDIHFEPNGQEVIIRFRIDGVLSEAGRIQKTYYENILNRIKVDARLRIDEQFE